MSSIRAAIRLDSFNEGEVAYFCSKRNCHLSEKYEFHYGGILHILPCSPDEYPEFNIPVGDTVVYYRDNKGYYRLGVIPEPVWNLIPEEVRAAIPTGKDAS